jgi:hypothetical protein
MNRKKRTLFLWTGIVVLSFIIVYACSLTYVYVEGDDAASIAFHTLGRNAAVQPHYAPYHGMMDVLFWLLPRSEPIVRLIAISVTSLAVVGMVLLMLELSFRLIGRTHSATKRIAAIAVLLAMPEFLFLGLVYMPSAVGMCCVLIAHRLLLLTADENGVPNLKTNRSLGLFAGSVLLFAMGAACRWDVLIYGGIIAAHLMLGLAPDWVEGQAPLSQRLRYASLWGGAALVVWIGLLALIGFPPTVIGSVLKGTASTPGLQAGLGLTRLAALLSLLTPASLLFTLAGWIWLFRHRKKIFALALVAFVLGLPFMKTGFPKAFIYALPMMVVCFVSGIHGILRFSERHHVREPMLGVMAVILFLPWVIGFRATMGDSAWGPGFELRPFNRPQGEGRTFELTLSTGAAIPTQEGPRPLWGYGGALLGGDWRILVRNREREVEGALEIAAMQQKSFLILQGSDGYATALLTRSEYTTQDPSTVKQPDSSFFHRVFTSSEGGRVRLVRSADPVSELLRSPETIDQLISITGPEVITYGFYPSSLREVYLRSPESLTPLADNTAVLNLKRLLSDIQSL